MLSGIPTCIKNAHRLSSQRVKHSSFKHGCLTINSYFLGYKRMTDWCPCVQKYYSKYKTTYIQDCKNCSMILNTRDFSAFLLNTLHFEKKWNKSCSYDAT